jgi:hypothetical protein
MTKATFVNFFHRSYQVLLTDVTCHQIFNKSKTTSATSGVETGHLSWTTEFKFTKPGVNPRRIGARLV